MCADVFSKGSKICILEDLDIKPSGDDGPLYLGNLLCLGYSQHVW